jgi:drug/metabolite transporter (DMT)-like permease
LRTPAGAIGLLAVTGMFQRDDLVLPFRRWQHWGAIAAAGILGTALGSLLYVYAVIHAGAARAVVLNATAPLMAVPLAIIFLGERFSQRVAIGTVLSVAGVIFVVS